MRQREIIRTTLGELIVAVTDEVMPIIRDPSGQYRVVSCILSNQQLPLAVQPRAGEVFL